MRVKNLILGIGIVIVYALMLWQGIEAFYPSPQYGDFCTGLEFGVYPKSIPGNPTPNCTTLSNYAEQERQCMTQEGNLIVTEYNAVGCPISVECNFCNKEFNDARESYSKTVFFIALILGIITLVIGYTILSIEPVGSALMASGVWAIFYGTVWNWANLSSIWRFVLLLLALVLLIWIALRINRKQKKGFFNFRK